METSFPTRRTCPLSITPRIVTSGTRKRRRTSSMHIETSFLALESALDHIASKQQGEGETDWLGGGSQPTRSVALATCGLIQHGRDEGIEPGGPVRVSAAVLPYRPRATNHRSPST